MKFQVHSYQILPMSLESSQKKHMKDIYAGSTIFQAHFELRKVKPAKKQHFVAFSTFLERITQNRLRKLYYPLKCPSYSFLRTF